VRPAILVKALSTAVVKSSGGNSTVSVATPGSGFSVVTFTRLSNPVHASWGNAESSTGWPANLKHSAGYWTARFSVVC